MSLDARSVAHDVERDLRDAATPGRAEKEKAYLKSDLTHLGAPVPAIRKVVRSTRRAHPDLTHDDLVALVTELCRRRFTSVAWQRSSSWYSRTRSW